MSHWNVLSRIHLSREGNNLPIGAEDLRRMANKRREDSHIVGCAAEGAE